MVQIVKHEWHQVDRQFLFDLDLDTLQKIFPDKTKKDLKLTIKSIEKNEVDLETLLQIAHDNGVDIDWEPDYDDWWTERKGGYEVTFEVAAK